MRRPIYNLLFPTGCSEITVHGHRFSRIEEYQSRVRKLQHLGGLFSEFQIRPNTGEHAVTGYVDIPEPAESSILEWAGEGNTVLMDILLLLSLFTGREVFAGRPGTTGLAEDEVITRDSRVYKWGGILRSSIPYERAKDRSISSFDCNEGFEETINQIYELIRSPKWQQKYQQGYFLFLARMAFQQHFLEAAFSQCWTIWEHLFTIHNRSWLSDKQLRRIYSDEKVAFLLTEYELINEIDQKSRQLIQSRLANIRNRLIHFGRFPKYDKVHKDADLFIRLTEVILAKTLKLVPSNVFNTIERLQEFLSGNEK